jgi:hypothetical protein
VAEARYRFVADGASDVLAAFKGVTAAARQSQVAAQRSGETVSRSSNAASRALSQEAAIARKFVAMRNAEAAAAIRSSRTAGAAFDAKMKASSRAAAAYEKNLRREVAADEAAQRRKTQNALREASKRDKAEARAAARLSADRQGTLGRVGAVAGGALAAVGGVAYGVGRDLAGRAFDAVGAAARDAIKLGDLANRVSIAGRQAGQEAVDPRILQKEFQNTALATPGVKATDVAEAVGAFVSLTGDLATARKSQGTFATVASASGADVKDVATAAASLSEKFDVKGAEEMQQALATLTMQGKSGAFEIKDAAIQFQRLASAADSFDIGKGGQAVAVLGGISQIARKGTGNARQATTAVENIFAGLTQKREMLEGDGVKFTNANGSKRDIRDLLIDTISTVGGNDMGKKESGLLSIFGKQGIRGVNPLLAAYSQTFQKTEGTEAQKTAAATERLRKMFEENINVAGDWKDIQKDAALAQQSSSAILEAAWEQLRSSTADALVPAIKELTPQIPTIVGALGGLAEAAASATAVLGGMAGFLKDNGLIDSTEAFKAPKNQADIKQLDKEIGTLEAKGDNRTLAENNKLDRLKDVRRSGLANLEGPSPFLDAPKEAERGFASYKTLGATPLTGIDAVANVMKMPSEEKPVQGMNGSIANQAVDIDTKPAVTSLMTFTGAIAAAAAKLTEINAPTIVGG